MFCSLNLIWLWLLIGCQTFTDVHINPHKQATNLLKKKKTWQIHKCRCLGSNIFHLLLKCNIMTFKGKLASVLSQYWTTGLKLGWIIQSNYTEVTFLRIVGYFMNGHDVVRHDTDLKHEYRLWIVLKHTSTTPLVTLFVTYLTSNMFDNEMIKNHQRFLDVNQKHFDAGPVPNFSGQLFWTGNTNKSLRLGIRVRKSAPEPCQWKNAVQFTAKYFNLA